jgi:hypothetical protein
MSVSPRALLLAAINVLIVFIVVIVWLSILFPRHWLFDLDAPPPRPVEMKQN